MPGVVRLTHGAFYADLIQDPRDAELWLYVVQREGSADVLALGSCLSEQCARDFASRILRDFADIAPIAATAP